MACKCKSKKACECEECPEWIFTFADLVMLMMGFFVILWVLKPAPGQDGKKDADAEEAWIHQVGEIRRAFGYIPDANSTDPVDKMMLNPSLPRGRRQGNEEMTPRESSRGTDEKTTDVRPGKLNVVGGRLMFAAGSAELLASTRSGLDDIADKIRGHFNIVLVKGHTSLDDFADGSDDQRMELSVKRAQAVRTYLISKGVAEDTVQVQGVSSHEPVRQRKYGTDAQAENRRVEVVVSSSLLEEHRDQGDLKPKSSSPAANSSEQIETHK
jgi:flagellar motor protein MotB